MMANILRMIAGVTGAALLAAAAHVTIAHTGGYAAADALLTIAIALGVGVGAIAVGSAWAARRWAVAVLIAVALLAGELFGLVRTAERLVDARDQRQAPVIAAAAKRAAVGARLAGARADLDALKGSPRLQQALTDKARADAAIIAQAALRGCARNCRALLQAQADTAARDVAAARAELAKRRAVLQHEIEAARSDLAALPVAPSSTPLADRVGVAGWALDVAVAALGSLGANGLGAILLAFAGHGGGPRRSVTARPAASDDDAAAAHIRKFCVNQLTLNEGGHVTLQAIDSAYIAWCENHDQRPLPTQTVARLVRLVFADVGIEVSDHDGAAALVGVVLRGNKLRLTQRLSARKRS